MLKTLEDDAISRLIVKMIGLRYANLIIKNIYRILKIRIGNRVGRAGPTVGWAKTRPDQNWLGFFGPKF